LSIFRDRKHIYVLPLVKRLRYNMVKKLFSRIFVFSVGYLCLLGLLKVMDPLCKYSISLFEYLLPISLVYLLLFIGLNYYINRKEE